MGAIYRVDRGVEPDWLHDDLVAEFGWAHLHAFNRLLAAEEGIDLTTMAGYGGTSPWRDIGTSLKPLFDLDAFKSGKLPAQECVAMHSRLNEILSAWLRGSYAGTAESEMRFDQLATLENLAVVVGACIETGRALTVE
ncbi:hypothetical protein [Actinoplanes siamensis]|uniref:Uncharacterized protein n=1 Tax=Actinoplanes siamensis TaxID=1223317 RepID=A0A919NEJ3_9ACTN|nr:hypothetical protein [Actinoplanes siamensis]GIF09822.1 hypothetical protein Asi03nite_73600 [Actinoplanes siamensis]